MNITLGGGIQKYRGKGRLRGFYGAEAGIMLGSCKETYSYGNAFSTMNNSPTSTDWSSGQAVPATSRPTEWKAGSTFGFNLRGFIGAEYFFAPKMSIGAEYGWGLGLSSSGEGESTVEFWNGTGTTSQTGKTGKSSSFAVDVDNAVWTETHVQGGQLFTGKIASRGGVSGHFQDIPISSSALQASSTEQYYQDVAIIAIRRPDHERNLITLSPKITSSGGQFTRTDLTDHDLTKTLHLPAQAVGQDMWISMNLLHLKLSRPSRWLALAISLWKNLMVARLIDLFRSAMMG